MSGFQKIIPLIKDIKPFLANLPQLISEIRFTQEQTIHILENHKQDESRIIQQISQLLLEVQATELDSIVDLLKQAEERNVRFEKELSLAIISQLDNCFKNVPKSKGKRERLKKFIGELSEHFGLHAAVIPGVHMVEHYLGTGGMLSLTAAGIAGALYFRLRTKEESVAALPEAATKEIEH